MDSKLLQLKIDPALKGDLETLAHYWGISITAFVKMKLTEAVRKDKKQMFTENGLTEEQEIEVLRREQEAVDQYRKGKLKAKNGKAFLKELNA